MSTQYFDHSYSSLATSAEDIFCIEYQLRISLQHPIVKRQYSQCETKPRQNPNNQSAMKRRITMPATLMLRWTLMESRCPHGTEDALKHKVHPHVTFTAWCLI